MANAQTEPSMDEILASIRRIIAEDDDPAGAAVETEPADEPVATDAAPGAAADPQFEPQAGAGAEPESEPAPELAPEQAARVESVVEAVEEEMAPAAEAAADTVEPGVGDAGAAADKGADEDAGKGDDFDSIFDQMEAAPDDGSPVSVVAIAEDEVDDEDGGVIELIQEVAAPEPAVESAPVIDETPATEPAFSLDSMLKDTTVTATSSAFESLQENVRLSNTGGTTLEDVVQQMLTPLLKDWLDAHLPRIVEEKVEEEVRRISRRR